MALHPIICVVIVSSTMDDPISKLPKYVFRRANGSYRYKRNVHRMKDKLRNTGCPEAISLAILGHSTNTVAANYGSGYALEVMREALVKVWEE